MSDDTDIRQAILTEFKQVLKLAPADYTENCTNVVMRLIEKEVRRALLRLKNQEVIVSNYTSFNGEHRIIFSSEIDAALEAGSGEAV